GAERREEGGPGGRLHDRLQQRAGGRSPRGRSARAVPAQPARRARRPLVPGRLVLRQRPHPRQALRGVQGAEPRPGQLHRTVNAALGSAGVILGFVASLGGIVTLGVGLGRHRSRLLVAGRTYVWLVAIGAVVTFVAMERALLTHDFSVVFVANNSSRHTPFPFNVATLWSALEGSIILWATVLSGYLVVSAV